jgi:hypothetical protein
MYKYFFSLGASRSCFCSVQFLCWEGVLSTLCFYWVLNMWALHFYIYSIRRQKKCVSCMYNLILRRLEWEWVWRTTLLCERNRLWTTWDLYSTRCLQVCSSVFERTDLIRLIYAVLCPIKKKKNIKLFRNIGWATRPCTQFQSFTCGKHIFVFRHL